MDIGKIGFDEVVEVTRRVATARRDDIESWIYRYGI